MEFLDITSEQAVVILSHFRSIADVTGRKLVAHVQGTAKTEQGDLAFLNTYRVVRNIPVRKYFAVLVDGVETRVKFEEGLDLEVRF